MPVIKHRADTKSTALDHIVLRYTAFALARECLHPMFWFPPTASDPARKRGGVPVSLWGRLLLADLLRALEPWIQTSVISQLLDVRTAMNFASCQTGTTVTFPVTENNEENTSGSSKTLPRVKEALKTPLLFTSLPLSQLLFQH